LDDIEKIADGAAGTNVVPGSLLVLAMLSTVTVLVALAVTTLVDEPATAVTLVVILLLSVVVDLAWKRSRARPEPLASPPRAQWPSTTLTATTVTPNMVVIPAKRHALSR
jgi:hypothetical protein